MLDLSAALHPFTSPLGVVLAPGLRVQTNACAEVQDIGFEEAHAALACLTGLAGSRPKSAATALAELVRRRGLERASEVLVRWSS